MTRSRLLSIKYIFLVWLPLAVIVLLSGSVYWLFNTTSGATWVWNSLEGVDAINLQSSKLSGDLSSGFVIEDMEYRSENLDLLILRTEMKIGPTLWPLSIQVDSLQLQEVKILTRSSVKVAQTAVEDGGLRDTLSAIDLPVLLEIRNAVLTGVSLQQDEQAPLALAHSIRLRATLDEELLVSNLDIKAKHFETQLQGNLELDPPFNLSAKMEGRVDPDGVLGDAILDIPFRLETSGSLDKLFLDLVSSEFNLELGGEITDPLSNPVWDIKAIFDRFYWQDGDAGQDFLLSGFNLVSKGGIEDWSFATGSMLQLAGLDESRFDLSGSGSASGISVDEGLLTGPGIDLGFTGNLDWSLQAEADLRAAIGQLDLSPWVPDWPAGESLTGTLELHWSDNGLKIPASELTIGGTDLVLGVEADIDIPTNHVNGRLAWKNLGWPLNVARPDYYSKSGQLDISGSIDKWVVNGGLDIQLGDHPQGRLDIQGTGDRTSTQLVIPDGYVLGGSISGKVDADWTQGLNWTVAVRAQDINPEPLLSGWPGRLDVEVNAKTLSQAQQIQVDLITLQGQLRDVPISARGGLLVSGTEFAFTSLEVRTDEALLQLDGNPAGSDGVTLSFSGYVPSKLVPGAAGKLDLEGRYSSYASQPQIEFQLEALDLAWNEFGISNLAVSTLDKETGSVLPALELSASGVTWNDNLIDGVRLVVSPRGEQQELKLSLMNEDVALNGMMSLTPENNRNPFAGAWAGEITQLGVDVGPAYQFELSKPAAFAWSSGSALLGPVCLSEGAEASTCLALDLQDNGDWSLVADVTAVPVNYLRDMFELDMHFEQLVEGHLEWHQPLGGPPTGGADFRITSGRVLDLLDDDLLTESNEGTFAFTLQNGNLEFGKLDIEFPGTGFIDVDYEVLDIVRNGSQEVRGRAIASLNHFKLLGQMALPGVDSVDGSFESDIQLGGTLADPGFEGAFTFSDGFVHYAPIGLKLEGIEFEGKVTHRDRGNFKGRFRAGEGSATLEGGFLFENLNQLKLDVSLQGDQLLLVNTESLKILTETDISVVMSPQRMDLNGKIMVPSASLTPANLLLGEVRDSEDLVIEKAGIETRPKVDETTGQTRVFGQLEVAIGDDVNLKVPGVELSIGGNTVFTWNGDSVPLAEGGYILNGEVDVYGPMLGIKNGSVSFPGVPADNPLLNIRAGRDIFGNTQIRSAGVRVIGSLKRPVVEAYTVPVTNEDRAWTLLITGTDFDQGQGVSGFDVGTYIAPKLYVSYGISLFEDENVISARYDIKKGFGVKVTSGQRETGVDMSYTIDR